SHAAQIARRLEDDLALRHFEAVAPIHAADDGELIAWPEVGIAYPCENLAGARPEEPRPRESPLCCPRRVVAARKGQQHLTRTRHGEDVTRWQIEGLRLPGVDARGEDLERRPIPAGAVDDRLAVGREPPGADHT